ncbi:MAG: hypothetical protein QOG62_1776 [Thermoleophilaceae bacterium]|nr:hypothetical protein [Thermoleophilaceae bacterium]
MSGPPDSVLVGDALREAGESVGEELRIEPLAGGASRDLWLISSGSRRWVLRRDPPGEIALTSREAEFAVQVAAHEAGVPVPRPIAFGDFGSPGMLMEFVEGESIARRVLRASPAGLVQQIGAAVAALGRVDIGPLEQLMPAPADPCQKAVDSVREELALTGEPLPVLELGLRWLTLNSPPPDRVGVVHGDLRLGNFLVGDGGLVALMDWEFWHLGDPLEDLAWVRARPWRFGADDRPVAGLGSMNELVEGLGWEPEPERLRWWDVISQAKWGAYCARQAALRREGEHASLERTVLGRRVAEAEWDMLELIEG